MQTLTKLIFAVTLIFSSAIVAAEQILQAKDLQTGDIIFWKMNNAEDRATHVAIVHKSNVDPNGLRIQHATDNPKYLAYVVTYLKPSAEIQEQNKYYYVLRIKDSVLRDNFIYTMNAWLPHNIPFNKDHEILMNQWDNSMYQYSTDFKLKLQQMIFAEKNSLDHSVPKKGFMCSEIVIHGLQQAFMQTYTHKAVPESLQLDPILCPPSIMMLALMRDKNNYEVLGELYIPGIAYS